MSKITRSQAVETISDAVEVASKAIPSGVLEAIPVVGKAFKVASTLNSISDQWVVTKLRTFFETLSSCDIEGILARAAHSREELQDLGERVVQAVALSQDFQKPELYARLFIAFAERALSAEELARYLSIFAPIHTPDLVRFAGQQNPYLGQPNNEPVDGQEGWFVAPEIGLPLVLCGLTAPSSFGGAFGMLSQKYGVTQSGVRFHTALVVANAKLGEYHRRQDPDGRTAV